MVQNSKNIPFYLAAVGLFISLKFSFSQADNEDLNFLLLPTDTLVGILTGSPSEYISDIGYFHQDLHLVIDKSCSGYNFWLLSFLILSYSAVRHFENSFHKFLMIPAALCAAYLLTIFVNSSRIFVSIVLQSHTKSLFSEYQKIIHEAIGITTNLTFLILAYLLVEKLFTHKRYHEKFSQS